MKFCSNCSKEYPDNQNFCADCGLELTQRSLEEEPVEGIVESTVSGDEKMTQEQASVDQQTPEEAEYCENCREEKVEGNFCEKCGHPYGKAKNSQLSETVEAVPQPAKQLSSKQRKRYTVVGAAVLIVLIFIFGTYKFGESYYSKTNQVERYQELLLSTDAEKIAKAVKSTDQQFQLTKENIQVYTNYLKDNKAYLTNLTNHLSNVKASESDVYLKKNGKHFFLFDKYDLMLQPVYFNVVTNVNGMSLAVNDVQEEAISDQENYTWKLGPLVPGDYLIKGTFDYNGEETTVEQVLEQIDREEISGKNTRNLSFEVMKVKVDVVSMIKDGELLVDGTSVAKLKDNGKTPLEMIWRDHAVLQIKQKVGELTLVSEPLDFYAENYLAEDYSSEYSSYNVPIHEFSVSSNVSEGTVYMNDQTIGTLSDGLLKNLAFVITEKPLDLKIKQKFGDDSEIESESFQYQLGDYYSDVYLPFETEIDDYDVSSFLNQLYYDVSDFSDDYYDFGSSEILTLESYFENGAANEEFVDFKDNFILPTRANENKMVSTRLAKVESVQRTGSKTYEVRYIVNYYTSYYDNRNAVDQYFRYTKATFVLDDTGELFIRDLGGSDHFEEVSEREAY